MRAYLLFFLLIPAVCAGQTAVYFSGDASANFGRHLEWTGFSANVSGNIKVLNKLYLGVATGALHIRPFINHLTIPLSARATFFTTNDDEKMSPFGMFEYGKLFYTDKGYAGIADNTMKGRHSFFAGVGVRLPSHRKTHPFFAIGYTTFYYANNQLDNQNNVVFSRPYEFRRIAIKAGIMLPRTWQRKAH